MLPPAHRMRRGSDFTLATRRGTKVTRGRVVVYLHSAVGEVEAARVGLIVPKSVGNSDARHRVSRRLRAAMAEVVTGLPAGALVVLRALPGAAQDTALASDTVAAVTAAHARMDSLR